MSRRIINEVLRKMVPCSDKDGIRIPKNIIVLLTFTILLIMTVSTAVAYTVGVKTTVDNIQTEIRDLRACKDDLTPRVYVTERDIAVIQAQYDNINKNMAEIKRLIETR